MVFGMNNTEFAYFTIITVSLLIGSLLGVFLCVIITARQNKLLGEEADKFRELYFYELDKWKNKYDKDDYEAY